jgi:hypothetical protein
VQDLRHIPEWRIDIAIVRKCDVMGEQALRNNIWRIAVISTDFSLARLTARSTARRGPSGSTRLIVVTTTISNSMSAKPSASR